MNYAILSDKKYLVEKHLDKTIAKIKKESDSDVEVINGNDKDFSVESLLNDLNTMPFLSEHRIFILENPIFLSTKGTIDDKQLLLLEGYLKSPADFSTLIFYVNQFKIDKRKKVVKSVIKHTDVYEPKDLDDFAIETIIRDSIRNLNIKIDPPAFKELVKRVSFDFDNWDNELLKLELYGSKTLNLNDIENLISQVNIDNVFELLNAVLDKDLNKSINVYRELPKSSSEPIALIMLLASQFRLVYEVKTLLQSGVAYSDVAKTLKVHPYRVQIARGIANKTTFNALLLVLSQLSTLEQKIKGGIINPDIGFELFLIEVCKS